MAETPPPPGSNTPEFTVSEISGAVKRSLESQFGAVRVRGEISGWKGPSASGHCYFGLKDDKSKLEAVIWKGVHQAMKIKPEEGLEVIASGKVTTFPGSSKYQLVIDRIEPAGVGALMMMLEARKRALAAEGLFDPARKKPIPWLPDVIGVVTSPTGAVIRDILHRLQDRFPRRVLVWPVAVQGEKCPAEVVAAIRGFNRLEKGGPVPRPDLIIVARGGGSLEDLWGFNDESVVRAAAASEIPLISAVGHETDVTLIDFAADRRAPTPTAAAEMATPVRADLLAGLMDLDHRRAVSLPRLMSERKRRLNDLARAAGRPEALLEAPRQRLDAAGAALPRALLAWRSLQETRFARLEGRLAAAHGRLVERAGAGRRAVIERAARLDAAGRRLTPHKAQRLAAAAERFGPALTRLAAIKRQALAGRPLPGAALARIVQSRHERLAALGRRMEPAASARLERARARLKSAGALLESYSFKGVLARGFALARDGAGHPIRSLAQLPPGARFTLTLADGEAQAKRLEEQRQTSLDLGLPEPISAGGARKRRNPPSRPE